MLKLKRDHFEHLFTIKMQKSGKSMVAVSCLGGISSNFNYYGVTDEEVKTSF
jgi:hypothetical protein